MTDSLGLAPYDYQDVKSTVPVLDYWRMAVPLRKDLGSEYWPTVNSMEWPWGTKGTYISKEAALRNGNLLGFNLFGTERTIRKYAKARNAHVIGDGIVAFPPCSPQPYCIILEVLGNKIAGTGKMCDNLNIRFQLSWPFCPRRRWLRLSHVNDRSDVWAEVSKTSYDCLFPKLELLQEGNANDSPHAAFSGSVAKPPHTKAKTAATVAA
ncbi:unnamed protein product [Cladocopium goreaui]|uniref:Ca(2+)/H(+) antiporter n=1 Tax=Cladocopium goreaui TaxID=2562237 RepID=A0A9P1CAL0_9DINO|nr:unnamed protein product [Cladocopium goreaui]